VAPDDRRAVMLDKIGSAAASLVKRAFPFVALFL
jgi:hypothetical protein